MRGQGVQRPSGSAMTYDRDKRGWERGFESGRGFPKLSFLTKFLPHAKTNVAGLHVVP